MTMDILIVGGGIAGLTLAAAVAKRGAAVDVVEIAPKFGDQGGVGLTIVANAMAALDDIGVAEQCVAAGMPADTIVLRALDGQVIATPPQARIGGPKWPGGTGISRAVFHEILVDAAAKAGARLRPGVTVKTLVNGPAEAQVEFTDGGSGRYDLVVAADGVYSKTRHHVFGASHTTRHTGQAVWRAWMARPPELRQTNLVFGGPLGAVGFCPISEEDGYLYIVEAAPDNPWLDPATLHLQMQERLTGYGGFVPEMAAQLTDPAKVSYRPLEWHLAPSPWFKDRVVVIGDAAHANPPVLAQGAAMGIEDAVVLAQCLEAAGSIDDALTAFMQRRFERAKRVVDASVQLAQWEVDHTPGVDVPGVMASIQTALSEPF